MASEPETRLELVHFGHQCPWTSSTEANLRRIAVESSCSFCTTDLQAAPGFSREGIYFPFNVLRDGRVVTGSPLFGDSTLATLSSGETLPLSVTTSGLAAGRLTAVRPLSAQTIEDSISVCCNGQITLGQKREWYLKNSTHYHGLVGYHEGVPKAILEFMNCSHFPYPVVPRSEDALGILCLYSNDPAWDFREHLLQCFLDTASRDGFACVYVISGRAGSYPNGDQAFFESQGFQWERTLGQTWIVGQGTDTVSVLKWEHE